MTRDQMHNTLRYVREQLANERGEDYSGVMALDMVLEELEQEPCDDAISRQAVLDAFMKLDIELRPSAIDAILNMVNGMPSVKQEPKTGHWIKQTLSVKPFGEDTVLCDECAFMTDKDNNYNYCPNCGAKMVEPQKSEDKE